jgi:hypothetical protein
MKNYVGKKIKGFKFKDWTNSVCWNEDMEVYIGEVGLILEQYSRFVMVEFDDDNVWGYPISLIEDNLVEEEDRDWSRIVTLLKSRNFGIRSWWH